MTKITCLLTMSSMFRLELCLVLLNQVPVQCYKQRFWYFILVIIDFSFLFFFLSFLWTIMRCSALKLQQRVLIWLQRLIHPDISSKVQRDFDEESSIWPITWLKKGGKKAILKVQLFSNSKIYVKIYILRVIMGRRSE